MVPVVHVGADVDVHRWHANNCHSRYSSRPGWPSRPERCGRPGLARWRGGDRCPCHRRETVRRSRPAQMRPSLKPSRIPALTQALARQRPSAAALGCAHGAGVERGLELLEGLQCSLFLSRRHTLGIALDGCTKICRCTVGLPRRPAAPLCLPRHPPPRRSEGPSEARRRSMRSREAAGVAARSESGPSGAARPLPGQGCSRENWRPSAVGAGSARPGPARRSPRATGGQGRSSADGTSLDTTEISPSPPAVMSGRVSQSSPDRTVKSSGRWLQDLHHLLEVAARFLDAHDVGVLGRAVSAMPGWRLTAVRPGTL